MMTPSEEHIPKRAILFVESQPQWRERFTSLPFDSVEVSILSGFEEALEAISDPQQRYLVLVTNVNFDETGNENLGFALAQKLKELCLATQVVFLDRMAPDFLKKYAKFIFQDLKSFDYVEKDTFNLPDFMGILEQAMQKAVSEQRVILLSPEREDKDKFFEEIVKPVAQAAGIQCDRAGHNLSFPTHERMDLVRFHIRSARIIVADLRAQEPNVYYETGIADTLPVSLLRVAGARQIHQQLSSLDRIDIPDNKSWKKAVRSELENRVRLIINGTNASRTRTTVIQEDPSLCLCLIPEDEDSQDTYQDLVLPLLDNLKLNYLQVNNQGLQMSLARICNKIHEARLVVFDISNEDAFLSYCAGYAAGLGKRLVIITQDRNNIPVDFNEHGYVLFSKRTQANREQAKRNIGITIKDNMLANNGGNMKKVKVFINHAKEDDTLAQNLFNELKKIPWIDPWLDIEKLIPGQDWQYEIQKAMEEVDSVLICMSTNSVDKVGFVQAEINKAQQLQLLRPPGKIFMIPVLLEKCDVPLGLRKYQWVEITIPGDLSRIIRSLETLR